MKTKTKTKKRRHVGFYAPGALKDTRLLYNVSLRLSEQDRASLARLVERLDRKPGDVMRIALRELAAKHRAS